MKTFSILLIFAAVGWAHETPAARLEKRIAKVCPIAGVSIGNMADKSSWRIDFRPEATPDQRSISASIVATWTETDFDPPADKREARYHEEADPFLIAIMGYQIEIDAETDQAAKAPLQIKQDKLKADYLAAKRKIRQEIPDK